MRIVVVDPSRTIQKVVSLLLATAGHDARLFCDGIEALDHIKADPQVDALITSVELPTISGIELCRAVRQLADRRRPIYIMLMSASYEQAKLAGALESGADDYVGKPPAAEELHARLRAAERIASAQRELVQIATTDSLTGLLNRHEFFERADAICARATVGSAPSAIMLDIDNFKRVNDSHGHAVGDAVIRSVGAELARTREIVGRLGGEEFAILLEGRALPDALRLAERLRAAMAQIEIVATGGPVRFTCSFGADEWEFGDTIDDLLQRADMALYVAKANGRNRVVAYEPAMAGPGVGTGIVRVAGR